MATLINWKDRYSVGFELIDDQHKQLVDMINDLYSSFIEGTAQDKASAILEKMIDYTDYHFTTEEKFFDKYKYPETEEHKIIHASFVEKTIELKEEFDSGKVTISYDIMNYLRQWLLEHILKEDKKFEKFFKQNDIKLNLIDIE